MFLPPYDPLDEDRKKRKRILVVDDGPAIALGALFDHDGVAHSGPQELREAFFHASAHGFLDKSFESGRIPTNHGIRAEASAR